MISRPMRCCARSSADAEGAVLEDRLDAGIARRAPFQ